MRSRFGFTTRCVWRKLTKYILT